MGSALEQGRVSNNYIAADQALVMLFNKILDPGSVVRESEFARTPIGASMIKQLLGKFQAIATGGVKLTDEDRQELVDSAGQLAKVAQDAYLKHRDHYSDVVATDFGIKPRMIVGPDVTIDFTEIGTAEEGLNEPVPGTDLTPNQAIDELKKRGRF